MKRKPTKIEITIATVLFVIGFCYIFKGYYGVFVEKPILLKHFHEDNTSQEENNLSENLPPSSSSNNLLDQNLLDSNDIEDSTNTLQINEQPGFPIFKVNKKQSYQIINELSEYDNNRQISSQQFEFIVESSVLDDRVNREGLKEFDIKTVVKQNDNVIRQANLTINEEGQIVNGLSQCPECAVIYNQNLIKQMSRITSYGIGEAWNFNTQFLIPQTNNEIASINMEFKIQDIYLKNNKTFIVVYYSADGSTSLFQIQGEGEYLITKNDLQLREMNNVFEFVFPNRTNTTIIQKSYVKLLSK